jgi:uncharacterized protein Usg
MELLKPKIEIAGFGLTTASILYRLPDFPDLLQTFVWQRYDVAPQFPELQRFIDFWQREIEGALQSVTVAHHRLLAERDLRAIAAEVSLN